MTDIAPPVIGQEPWGNDLNAYLAYLEGKIGSGEGTPGQDGAKGDKGDPGDQGLDGSQGVPGPQGPEGPIGPQGPQGEAGVEGGAGPAGPSGPAGSDGPQGALGPEGPQGIQGISVGAAAFDWSNSNVVADPGVGGLRCNTTVPADSTEWYVSRYDKGGAVVRFSNLHAGTPFLIYESKKYNTWDRYQITGDAIDMGEWLKVPVAFVESGPQPFMPGGNAVVQIESEAGNEAGPPGPTGPQGQQGVPGPSGPAGVQGPAGGIGPQGPQGIPGPAGPQGSQGAAGPQGDAGSIIIAQSTTRATVVNTAAESVLVNIPIPANAVGAVYSLDVWGDILNSAANYGYTFRLRQGGLVGQLIFDMAAQPLAANASPRNWSSRVIIMAVDAGSSDVSMTLGIGAQSAPSRMTSPTLVNGVNPAVSGFGSPTTLTLTVQIATANAAANARLLGYFLRRIG